MEATHPSEGGSGLEGCPPEVLAHLFDLACRDDGTTGRSPSRTSRYIRSASASYHFRSILVRSPAQLFKLDSTLANVEPERKRTKFLCILLTRFFVFEAYPDESDWASEHSEDSDPDGEFQDLDTNFPQTLTEFDTSDEEEDSDTSSFFEYQEFEDESSELAEEVAYIKQEREELADQLEWRPFMTGENPDGSAESREGASKIGKFEERIYTPPYRLLEGCSDSQEFTLYMAPAALIPHVYMFPPLPKLRYLAVYIKDKGSNYMERNLVRGVELPLFFTAVEVVRPVGSRWEYTWFSRLLASCPKKRDISVVTNSWSLDEYVFLQVWLEPLLTLC